MVESELMVLLYFSWLYLKPHCTLSKSEAVVDQLCILQASKDIIIALLSQNHINACLNASKNSFGIIYMLHI
jgi:hypothetical protein